MGKMTEPTEMFSGLFGQTDHFNVFLLTVFVFRTWCKLRAHLETADTQSSQIAGEHMVAFNDLKKC